MYVLAIYSQACLVSGCSYLNLTSVRVTTFDTTASLGSFFIDTLRVMSANKQVQLFLTHWFVCLVWACVWRSEDNLGARFLASALTLCCPFPFFSVDCRVSYMLSRWFTTLSLRSLLWDKLSLNCSAWSCFFCLPSQVSGIKSLAADSFSTEHA